MYIFNECSLKMGAISKVQAYKIIKTFVEACVEARKQGYGHLRLYEASLTDLYGLPIDNHFNIHNWLNDDRVDEVLREQFRLIVTEVPLINADEVETLAEFERSEFKKILNGVPTPVFGLGAAYLFDALAISLSTDAEWEKDEVEIQHFFLDANLQEGTGNVNIRHFSAIKDLESHQTWWEAKQKDSLKKSSDLWSRKEEFFPEVYPNFGPAK